MSTTLHEQKEEIENRLSRFEASCREKGLRVTQQRREIFRTVAQSSAHPSAESVFMAVRKKMPNDAGGAFVQGPL